MRRAVPPLGEKRSMDRHLQSGDEDRCLVSRTSFLISWKRVDFLKGTLRTGLSYLDEILLDQF